MYIRTKNGRIIDTTKIVTGSKFMDFATNDESFRIIFKTEPLSKSESLEELCDGFYIDVDLNVERNFEYAFHHFEHFAKTMKSFRTTSKAMVKRLSGGYGYIRTNKCLLYVAKLNDKGELELL